MNNHKIDILWGKKNKNEGILKDKENIPELQIEIAYHVTGKCNRESHQDRDISWWSYWTSRIKKEFYQYPGRSRSPIKGKKKVRLAPDFSRVTLGARR